MPKTNQTGQDSQLVDSISSYQRFGPRELLRHIAISALAKSKKTVRGFEEDLLRPRVHFVCLHSVFSDEARGFESLVGFLSKTHRFISYSDAVQRVWQGPIDQPYMTFSFDDGMKNNIRAAEILREYGASCCFFVCTDMIGEKRFERIREFCRERLHFAPVEFLEWSDLEHMRSMGHEIGSHGASHSRLSGLDKARLKHELESSRDVLSARFEPPRHFAWPYGRVSDAPRNLGKNVIEAGYDSCASALRGCHVSPAGQDRASLCIRREHILANWPLEHVLFFLSKSASKATAADNIWPNAA